MSHPLFQERKMNKNLIGLTLLFVFLSGCVQVNSVPDYRSSQLAVSSVRDFPVHYKEGATFSLTPRYGEQQASHQAAMKQAYETYADQIIKLLEANGYQHEPNATPDFYVGYGIALNQDFSDKDLNEKFGVLPGLQDVDDMERGSFLIYIEDVVMAKPVWRGAVQGFVQDEFSAQEREQRAANVVGIVFRQFLATK